VGFVVQSESDWGFECRVSFGSGLTSGPRLPPRLPLITYRLRGKVWLYDGPAAWHFFTLPKRQAREIRLLLGSGVTGRGWGSIRVTATLGGTSWKTSIFPDKRLGSYLLPVKAEVRAAEGVGAGDTVDLVLEVEA
jgi:hypothetical protein